MGGKGGDWGLDRKIPRLGPGAMQIELRSMDSRGRLSLHDSWHWRANSRFLDLPSLALRRRSE